MRLQESSPRLLALNDLVPRQNGCRVTDEITNATIVSSHSCEGGYELSEWLEPLAQSTGRTSQQTNLSTSCLRI